jgi:hypothetical protein
LLATLYARQAHVGVDGVGVIVGVLVGVGVILAFGVLVGVGVFVFVGVGVGDAGEQLPSSLINMDVSTLPSHAQM